MLLTYQDHTNLEIITLQKRSLSTVPLTIAGFPSTVKFTIWQSWFKRILLLKLANLWSKLPELILLIGLMNTLKSLRWLLMLKLTFYGITAHREDIYISHHWCLIQIGTQQVSRLHGGETDHFASVGWVKRQEKLEFSIN